MVSSSLGAQVDSLKRSFCGFRFGNGTQHRSKGSRDEARFDGGQLTDQIVPVQDHGFSTTSIVPSYSFSKAQRFGAEIEREPSFSWLFAAPANLMNPSDSRATVFGTAARLTNELSSTDANPGPAAYNLSLSKDHGCRTSPGVTTRTSMKRSLATRKRGAASIVEKGRIRRLQERISALSSDGWTPLGPGVSFRRNNELVCDFSRGISFPLAERMPVWTPNATSGVVSDGYSELSRLLRSGKAVPPSAPFGSCTRAHYRGVFIPDRAGRAVYSCAQQQKLSGRDSGMLPHPELPLRQEVVRFS
ncbi:unnamed protein product [Amoebophrya sp. A25]|nr:unnamed protein product [Amoebophrya sp. A25]|eukprot:GSA25T00000418001.1